MLEPAYVLHTRNDHVYRFRCGACCIRLEATWVFFRTGFVCTMGRRMEDRDLALGFTPPVLLVHSLPVWIDDPWFLLSLSELTIFGF
jgi:hypothetical protein